MSSLGEVEMLSHVRIQTTPDVDGVTPERQERLLMLFSDVLLVLSVTSRISGYVYKVHTSTCVSFTAPEITIFHHAQPSVFLSAPHLTLFLLLHLCFVVSVA